MITVPAHAKRTDNADDADRSQDGKLTEREFLDAMAKIRRRIYPCLRS